MKIPDVGKEVMILLPHFFEKINSEPRIS